MANKNYTKKTGMSQEQKARRVQQVMFSMLAIVMILSMVLMLVAK